MSRKIALRVAVVFLLALGLGGGMVWSAKRPSLPAAKETAYERVTRTKVLRCAYLPFEPYITKDPNTKSLGGLTVDYVNAVAARAGLTVDWAGEVNIDQIPTALDYGRFDAFCLPCTPSADWGRVLDFGGFLGAVPYYTYVAADRPIGKEQLQTAKFATVDGYMLSEITRDEFPKAQYASLPQTTSMAEMYDQLRYHKADAMVNDIFSASLYTRGNPDAIKPVSDEPVTALRMFLVLPKNDAKLKQLIDDTFDADKPENTALMRNLLGKHNLPGNALFLGDQCKRSPDTAKGWKVCAKP